MHAINLIFKVKFKNNLKEGSRITKLKISIRITNDLYSYGINKISLLIPKNIYKIYYLFVNKEEPLKALSLDAFQLGEIK